MPIADPGVEAAMVEQLAVGGGEEAVRHRVVVRIANAAHGRTRNCGGYGARCFGMIDKSGSTPHPQLMRYHGLLGRSTC